jgi:hypothetical protein
MKSKALLLQFCLPADIAISVEEFFVDGSETYRDPESMEYVIHTINLSQEDRHNLRIDSAHMPRPLTQANSRVSFELPPSDAIRFVSSFKIAK